MKAPLDKCTLEIRCRVEDAEFAFRVVVAPVAGHPKEEGADVAAVSPEPMAEPPDDREVDRVEIRRGIWMGFRACHRFSHTLHSCLAVNVMPILTRRNRMTRGKPISRSFEEIKVPRTRNRR